MKERVVKIITFLGGLYYFLEFVLPEEINGQPTYLSSFIVPMGNILMVLWGFAVGLGLINLSIAHSKKIKKLESGWIYSVAFFVAMFAMMIACFMDAYHPTSLAKQFYKTLFTYMYMPLGATIFSLLALFMVTSAYRAMRVRTFEATVMVVSACIIMLGQVPIGLWITRALPPGIQLPKVSAWLLWIANTAAYRAVMFGIYVGSIAIALRMWLSLERGMQLK
ncbi:MAG: hypothetical protein U9R01_01885 [candidate division WOR-3 bacterium]|nr:hypothetical protein [candidate division WOR-3 bacterium]